MEVPLPWLLSLSLIIILTTIVLTFSRKPGSKSPPGPSKLPLIGNLHQLVLKNPLPHRCLAELAAEYGPIMELQLGEVPIIVISSAEMAKEVMKTHDAACCSRPQLMVGKEIFYNCSDIGLAPYGEYWRQVRRIATLELFTWKRVKSFRTIREEEVTALVHSIASQAGSVVNLSGMLFGLAFDITSRVAFTTKGKDQEAFRALAKEITKAGSCFSVADLYPSSKLLHVISGMRRKMKECILESNKILDPIIEEHKLKKRNDEEDECLMDVLLKFHKDNTEDVEFSLSVDNIKAVILELFGAGSETSSTLIEWAMSELIKNPRAMKRAQSEVRQVYQPNGLVDEAKVDQLKYLKLVIKETLRLHPPLPLLGPRETLEKCQIQCYDIAPRTRVIVNAWDIGRNPKHWLEPDKFMPERFEDSSIDFKGLHFELIPFGAGRRQCPGISLGIANVELPLAMLLYHFDWKLPNKEPEELNMDESFGLTMRRKNELHVLAIRFCV